MAIDQVVKRFHVIVVEIFPGKPLALKEMLRDPQGHSGTS